VPANHGSSSSRLLSSWLKKARRYLFTTSSILSLPALPITATCEIERATRDLLVSIRSILQTCRVVIGAISSTQKHWNIAATRWGQQDHPSQHEQRLGFKTRSLLRRIADRLSGGADLVPQSLQKWHLLHPAARDRIIQ